MDILLKGRRGIHGKSVFLFISLVVIAGIFIGVSMTFSSKSNEKESKDVV